MTRDEAVQGGIWGLLIGDALGVPYEFHDPANLPPPEQIEMIPPPGFRRSHRGTPPGTWSDDGAQALALLDSLLSCGGLDPDDLGRRFLAWWHEGAYTPDGRAFDIGNQTSDALLRLEAGVRATAAGGRGERDNGNGSLMRVLPLALWHRGPDEALVELAHLQSRITHAHPRGEAACALYVLWARGILEGTQAPWAHAIASLQQIYRPTSAHARELSVVLEHRGIRGSGYVVDCLHSARHALAAGRYEAVVRRAIGLGLDTDTTAAVAGGLAGLRHGLLDIPARWRGAMRGRALVHDLLERLLDHLS